MYGFTSLEIVPLQDRDCVPGEDNGEEQRMRLIHRAMKTVMWTLRGDQRVDSK